MPLDTDGTRARLRFALAMVPARDHSGSRGRWLRNRWLFEPLSAGRHTRRLGPDLLVGKPTGSNVRSFPEPASTGRSARGHRLSRRFDRWVGGRNRPLEDVALDRSGCRVHRLWSRRYRACARGGSTLHYPLRMHALSDIRRHLTNKRVARTRGGRSGPPASTRTPMEDKA